MDRSGFPDQVPDSVFSLRDLPPRSRNKRYISGRRSVECMSVLQGRIRLGGADCKSELVRLQDQ